MKRMTGSTRYGMAIATAATAAALAAPGVADAAGTGYGQPVASVVIPSGFTSVAYAHTIGPRGAKLALSLANSQLAIDVPPGSVGTAVQVAISRAQQVNEPLPHVLRHWSPVASFGVLLRETGTEVRVAHGITLTITNSQVSTGDIVLIYNATVHHFIRCHRAVISGDHVTVRGLHRGQSITIVAPPH